MFSVLDADVARGRVVYRQSEQSFDFIPTQGGDSSLLIGYLNLEFDSGTRCVSSVWGFHPQSSWIPLKLTPPTARAARLSVGADEWDVVPGTSKRVADAGKWNTYHDKRSGWICVGSPKLNPEDQAVEFASRSIAVLDGSMLRAIWLKPEWLP